jgi:hypothetical protein
MKIPWLSRWIASFKVYEFSNEEWVFRTEMVRQAYLAETLSAGKLATLDAFRAILGCPPPGGWDLDRPFRIVQLGEGRIRTEGISTCGLGARGIGYNAGLLWPEFKRPYDYLRESVFAVMQAHANRFNARHTDKPLPGDAFIIGSGYSTHMATCVDWTGTFVTSIDAGQCDHAPDPGRANGLQCFRLVVRDWRAVHHVCTLDSFKLYTGFLADR